MKRTAPYYVIDNKNKNDGEIFLDKILNKAPHLVSSVFTPNLDQSSCQQLNFADSSHQKTKTLTRPHST